MDNRDNILKRLKDHEVQPPADMFDKIQEKIYAKSEAELRAFFEGLAMHMVQPPKNTVTTAGKEPITNAGTSAALLHATQRNKVIAVRPLLKYAAMLICIIAAGWMISLLLKNNKAKEQPPVTKTESAPVITDTASSLPLTTSPATKDNKYAGVIKTTINSKASYIINMQGYKIPVFDNDILATFANFDYKNIPPFLSKNKKTNESILINVDHYTSISISPEMQDIMKKMYTLKKNGKPTWKAKRERRKINRWKKADARFFDKKLDNDPMNPVQLGKLIF